MQLILLRDHPQWREKAVDFFCTHWGVDPDEYMRLTDACIARPDGLPQFYLAVDAGRIAGGTDVQLNDEHDRPDLAPNICDVYVEEAYRHSGLAGRLLAMAEEDMRRRGVEALYLLTELEGFYEQYGWTQYAVAHWFWLGGKLSNVYRKDLREQ